MAFEDTEAPFGELKSLSQQSVGLEGWSTVIPSQESRFERGGGEGGSIVILSARCFVGITSSWGGNCIVTSCLVMPGCCIKSFFLNALP